MDDSGRYLHLAAQELSNSSPAVEALKAYYIQKFNSPGLASHSHDQRQTVSTTCFKCSSPWTNGALNLSVKSCKKAKKRTRNFVINHYKDKKNLKLRRLSRKLALKHFSSMELTCKTCKSITKIPLLKSFQTKDKEAVTKAVKRLQITPPAGPPAKKKKKKRNAFAGLNKDVILAVQAKAKKTPVSEVSKKTVPTRPNIGKLASILQKKASISGNSLDKMLK